MAQDDARATRTARTPTNIPLLILPVGFSNCKLTFADDDWYKKVFSLPTPEEEGRRFDLFGPCGTSVNRYFQEITCGRFQLAPVAENAGVTNDGVVRIELDRKHPFTDPDKPESRTRMVQEALNRAGRFVNFDRYDLDKDKKLSSKELAVVVIAAGGVADSTYSRNVCIYANLRLGGCRKRACVVVSERRDDLRKVYNQLAQAAGVEPKYKDFPVSLGTLIHELGHEFGTPDIPFVGYLSSMGNGQKNSFPALFPGTQVQYGRSTPSHYGAFPMVRDGFITPTVLERSGLYEAHSIDTGKYNVYKIPTKDPKEYFLVENRQLLGFDRGLTFMRRPLMHGGIVIWHINEAYGKTDPKQPMAVILDAGEAVRKPPAKRDRGPLKIGPFYASPGNVAFSADSTPNNRAYDGEPQRWAISNFSAPGGTMTFKFTQL